MFGLRRRAKQERDRAISEERLFTLVNHALLRNFGPLGSYSITMRSSADSDDIFHTMLADSIARSVTKDLAEANLVLVAAPVSLAPAPVVPVKMSLADAVSAAISPAFGPQVLVERSTRESETVPSSAPVASAESTTTEESAALVA